MGDMDFWKIKYRQKITIIDHFQACKCLFNSHLNLESYEIYNVYKYVLWTGFDVRWSVRPSIGPSVGPSGLGTLND